MKKHAALPPRRPGFTLVEVLVVIIIISILAALLIPAITGALDRANEAATKMEVSALSDAAEKYRQEHGDYPPDGSSWAVMQRHFRKVFPRMSAPDNVLLESLTHPGGTFSPVAMDRAEALVFFLGGFSQDKSHPLTGKGGPLEFNDYTGDGDATNLANYQYNATRDNSFFDFDTERLDMVLDGSRYRSSDEEKFGYSDPQLTAQGGYDLLPAYSLADRATAVVYFDSRTYGMVGTDPSGAPIYNGFLVGGEFGAVRPYKTELNYQPPSGGGSYGDTASAFNAVKFQKPDSFQIISPGDDGVFGAIVAVDPSDPTSQPVHFTTENGYAVTPNASASDFAGLRQIPTGSGTITIEQYQDVDWNSAITVTGHLDNVTNFSSSTLEADLE